MFDLKKSPLSKLSKHNSSDSGLPVNPRVNPFDSDEELDNRKTLKPSARTPSDITSNLGRNPCDDDEIKSSASESFLASARSKYKNGFRDSGGLENQSVQGLENYAVYKAEETTRAVKGCLKIAEDMREDATRTLVTLHQQGEQITKTHTVTADMDHDLSRGEKLLGSLGGIFSKTWKPKKNLSIKGPVITRGTPAVLYDPVHRKGNHLEQRERLDLASTSNERSHTRKTSPEPTNALQKVESEKAKQDDALTDLSNILGELKEMAIDMGSEIERHNKALVHLDDDVDEINSRVKGAVRRTRRLLGK